MTKANGYPHGDLGIDAQLRQKSSNSSRPHGIGLLIVAVLEYLTGALAQKFDTGQTYLEACGNIAAAHHPGKVEDRRKVIANLLSRCRELEDETRPQKNDYLFMKDSLLYFDSFFHSTQ